MAWCFLNKVVPCKKNYPFCRWVYKMDPCQLKVGLKKAVRQFLGIYNSIYNWIRGPSCNQLIPSTSNVSAAPFGCFWPQRVVNSSPTPGGVVAGRVDKATVQQAGFSELFFLQPKNRRDFFAMESSSTCIFLRPQFFLTKRQLTVTYLPIWKHVPASELAPMFLWLS